MHHSNRPHELQTRGAPDMDQNTFDERADKPENPNRLTLIDQHWRLNRGAN